MRCFRATIRLGMRPRIRFCSRNNEAIALKCVTCRLNFEVCDHFQTRSGFEEVLHKLSHCLPALPCRCMQWWQSRWECSSTMFWGCRGPAAQHSAAAAAGSSAVWTARGWTPSPYSEAGGQSVGKRELFSIKGLWKLNYRTQSSKWEPVYLSRYCSLSIRWGAAEGRASSQGSRAWPSLHTAGRASAAQCVCNILDSRVKLWVKSVSCGFYSE